jgi:non-specific serine/threonine protein kinase
VAAAAVLEVLDELLERSLVSVQYATGAPRYGLLETVRQYGLQQMERAEETAIVRDRHLRWCVGLAEQATPALQGPEQGAWLARLAREHDNLRAGLQWALDRGHSALGLRLAAGLWPFWLRRGHAREGRHWLTAFLALPTPDDDATTAARATASEGAAWLAEDQHDFTQASTLFGQSVALRETVGQEERTAALLITAAMEARAGGDYARAAALLDESLAQHRTPSSRNSTVRDGLELSLFRLALVKREQGDYARAAALCEEYLALAREQGDAEGIGLALLSLGDIARDQGDAARVRALCEESLALFRELGQQWAMGFALNNLALAAYQEGDLALAAQHAEESATIFRGLQAGPSVAEVLLTLSRIKDAQQEVTTAWASAAQALSLAWEKGPRVVVAAALEELAVQAIRQGATQQGVDLMGGAARLRGAMGAPVRPTDRQAIEGALAAARASLGNTAFTDAWAAGHALPVEQVVARALADPLASQHAAKVIHRL